MRYSNNASFKKAKRHFDKPGILDGLDSTIKKEIDAITRMTRNILMKKNENRKWRGNIVI